MQAEIKLYTLKHLLEVVPLEGWSEAALTKGAQKAGYDPALAGLLFPAGVMEAVDFYLQNLDSQMLGIALSETRVSLRIKEMLVNRIKLLASNKPLTAKTVSYLALPWNIPKATRFIWRTVDHIWYEAGHDASTDYNYYTKRSLLASIYSSSIMHLLSDESKGCQDTIAFIDRRFLGVAEFNSMIGKVKAKFNV